MAPTDSDTAFVTDAQYPWVGVSHPWVDSLLDAIQPEASISLRWRRPARRPDRPDRREPLRHGGSPASAGSGSLVAPPEDSPSLRPW